MNADLRTCFVLSVSLFFAATAGAEPGAGAVQVTATPKRVSMFKNGFGLEICEAKLPANEHGKYILTPLPRATFGSFWLNVSPNVELTRVRTTQAWVTQDVPADEIETLLRNSFGADATFDPESVHVQRRIKQPVLAFDAQVPASGGTLGLVYLAQGIAWSPSYTVHLLDDQDDRVRITAKAVVVNDLIDLENAAVELIAGYPNLKFAAQPSAMSPQPLQQLLNQLRNAGSRNESYLASNVMMQQRAVYERNVPGGFMPSMPASPVSGEDAEDLYFYQLDNITLAKGERGYFPLFVAEVPAEHIYTWDIPDFINDNSQYQREQVERIEVVWHQLKLTNTTESPWTTAAAMTFKHDRVLGQDTIFYTPPKGSTRLRITQAVAIDAEQNEYEIDRQRNAKRFHGRDHDLVTIQGELKLTNYKSKAVEVIVTKMFSGELTEALQEHEIYKLAHGLRRINPRSKIEWCVSLEPAKDNAITLTYRYQVYTR